MEPFVFYYHIFFQFLIKGYSIELEKVFDNPKRAFNSSLKDTEQAIRVIAIFLSFNSSLKDTGKKSHP